ncbi:MAG: cell envelope integrity protein TolA [Verrucomicrobia bacterium]|nr:cell envelope integrity protein TolA [Verrucomicrobiota bacterium]
MTSTSPGAFLLSALLHAAAVGLALLFGYTLSRPDQDSPKIIELVAGEGDNYGAREAPALGTEGGVRLKVPDLPAPKSLPEPEPAPVTPAPTPVKPVPVPPAPTPAPTAQSSATTGDGVPNFKKKIQWEIVRGDAKAKLQLRREREAEAKRLAEEKKWLTKEEFDRAQKSRVATKGGSTKAPQIDAEGIAKGVVGGSPDNKTGGAGGKALRNDNDDVLAGYYAMFKQRLRTEFEPPPGLSDSLKATVEVRSNLDGSLSNAKIVRTSGSREFDRAVIEAIGRVRMPSRPEKRAAETIEFVFTMRERDER